MANAAAKKAAAAKTAAANWYRPALILSNVLYLLLWLGRNGWRELSFGKAIGMIIAWGLQWYAYISILHAAQHTTTTTTKQQQSNALVGGSSLDLLALTLILQFGSVLWSWRVYWLLLLVPPWAAWNVYSIFYRGGGANSSTKSRRK